MALLVTTKRLDSEMVRVRPGMEGLEDHDVRHNDFTGGCSQTMQTRHPRGQVKMSAP